LQQEAGRQDDRRAKQRQDDLVTGHSADKVTIAVNDEVKVSGLMIMPPGARACYVMAHGAGGGMKHPFMEAMAAGFSARGIASLRYQFSYMALGGRRPDPPALAQATVRAAVDKALERAPGMPLFAGGKSFGGRMTSQAQAEVPLPGVKGLVFLGFPLHPAGKPSVQRGQHLFGVQVPMLFLQGTRDQLADLDLLKPLVKRLGQGAVLNVFHDADHSFHVPVRSGVNDAEIRDQIADSIAAWVGENC
jgi:predicted alpha/beta-hydrolase family hydrolase